MDNDKIKDDEDFNITDHLIKKDNIIGNTWYTLHKLPDIPDTYIPSKKEIETPWWRRYENKKRKKY